MSLLGKVLLDGLTSLLECAVPGLMSLLADISLFRLTLRVGLKGPVMSVLPFHGNRRCDFAVLLL